LLRVPLIRVKKPRREATGSGWAVKVEQCVVWC
jgi:hypothetical protein